MSSLLETFVIEMWVVVLAYSEGGMPRSLFQHILHKDHYDDGNRLHSDEVCEMLQNIMSLLLEWLSIRLIGTALCVHQSVGRLQFHFANQLTRCNCRAPICCNVACCSCISSFSWSDANEPCKTVGRFIRSLNIPIMYGLFPTEGWRFKFLFSILFWNFQMFVCDDHNFIISSILSISHICEWLPWLPPTLWMISLLIRILRSRVDWWRLFWHRWTEGCLTGRLLRVWNKNVAYLCPYPSKRSVFFQISQPKLLQQK